MVDSELKRHNLGHFTKKTTQFSKKSFGICFIEIFNYSKLNKRQRGAQTSQCCGMPQVPWSWENTVEPLPVLSKSGNHEHILRNGSYLG